MSFSTLKAAVLPPKSPLEKPFYALIIEHVDGTLYIYEDPSYGKTSPWRAPSKPKVRKTKNFHFQDDLIVAYIKCGNEAKAIEHINKCEERDLPYSLRFNRSFESYVKKVIAELYTEGYIEKEFKEDAPIDEFFSQFMTGNAEDTDKRARESYCHMSTDPILASDASDSTTAVSGFNFKRILTSLFQW